MWDWLGSAFESAFWWSAWDWAWGESFWRSFLFAFAVCAVLGIFFWVLLG